MLKVMMIDDEQNILTGLRYLIDWGAQGFDICGTFSNPREALAEAPNLCPDLIITDIEMPGTFGLDLIATLREQLPKSLFVILSAYEDFQYAKRAVELGAFRYLLKPLADEDLIDLLAAVRKHFSAGDSMSAELSAFRNFVVREVVFNGLALSHAAQIPYYRDLLDQQNLQLVLVKDAAPGSAGVPDREMIETLQDIFAPKSIFTAGDGVVMLLEVREAVTQAAIKEKVGPWRVEVSDVFCGLAAAHGQYAKLTKTMQGNLFWEDLPKAAKDTAQKALPDEETLAFLRRAIWYCDTAALESAFERLWAQFVPQAGVLEKADVVRVYDDLFKITATMLQNVSAYNLTHQNVGVLLWDCQTLSQMHSCALREFYTILNDIRGATNDSSLNLIRQAKAHIMERYMEVDFRLTDIADALYVNYSYLSNLFKQETGDTLSNYLLTQRMKKAKELLTDPILTVAEISQRVGYHNVKTFYSTFKKYFNESPRSYQQRHTKRKF